VQRADAVSNRSEASEASEARLATSPGWTAGERRWKSYRGFTGAGVASDAAASSLAL